MSVPPSSPKNFCRIAVASLSLTLSAAAQSNRHFASPSLEVELSADSPEFTAFDIDGLGQGKRGPDAIRHEPENLTKTHYAATFASTADTFEARYRRADRPASSLPNWIIQVTPGGTAFTSEWSDAGVSEPLRLAFDPAQCPVTLLGLPDADNHYQLPAILHLPNQGSLRIEVSGGEPATIGYIAQRRGYRAVGPGTVTLEFPAATALRPKITYRLTVCAIYPDFPAIRNDARFDSFRRNWLNELQFNPNNRMFANNSGSTSCAFCFYNYADIAALTPSLAKGLKATDLVRVTLDSIIAGRHAYGQPAKGNFPVESSDTLPSLLISAGVIDDQPWLESNYTPIKSWADKMLATDTTGDGLTKYKISGNSGIWSDGFPTTRPSNWWDTIGFGYEDAYGNALAFRGLGTIARIARTLGKSEDADRYEQARAKIKAAFFKTFYNPATGVLAGWKSVDGELHDYYFLWVNGIAIHYGLVTREQGNAIMDRIWAKMSAVGFSNFRLGLPGNLITVPLKDYVHRLPDARYGGGVREDNADGFQKYENGGATGAFAYLTLAALYDLGRKAEADAILLPMLQEYDHAGYSQRAANGMSTDWRMWDGTPMGYEGFLVDDYHALLAVAERAKTEENSSARATEIRPGESWLDTAGNPIQAHGGAIVRSGQYYYWFGEERANGLPKDKRYVGCYRSQDLAHWEPRGDVLQLADPESFGPSWILERPKVFPNAKTGKSVMYVHLDGPAPGQTGAYKLARVGVAVCDTVDGQYKYVASFRPLGHESRDIGQFIDDDGKAYLIFEDRPFGFRIAALSDDYLSVEREIALIPQHLEGGAIVHYRGLYYVIGSQLTGWRPNPNVYATAKHLAGPWSEFHDLAPPATNTYGSQSSYLLKVVGSKQTTVIFLGDRWKPKTLWDSRYLWMPVRIGDGQMALPPPQPWSIDVATGEVQLH